MDIRAKRSGVFIEALVPASSEVTDLTSPCPELLACLHSTILVVLLVCPFRLR